MRYLTHLILAFCLWLLAAGPAWSWVEAESENFILRGEIRAGDAKDVLRELEGFRANFFHLVQSEGSPEALKVRIYTVPNKDMLEDVTGRQNIGGLYNTDLQGPVFLLNTQKGFRNDAGQHRVGTNLRRGSKGNNKIALGIAFHEYSHHLMAGYTEAHYPRWYNEGFAEFLASYDGKKGQFSLGKAQQIYGSWLEYGNWIPMETILKSVRSYPYSSGSRGQSQFYAQTWLMVHYLQNTPEMGPRVNTYMAELNRGKDPIESFAPAMGMTVDEFSSLIRDYYKAGRLAVTTFKSPVNPKAASITVKDISEAEGKMHLLDAARLFASSETATAWADKIENRHGSSYLLHLGRARLALEKQDESSALISVGKALQLQPNAPEALRVAAAAQLAGYRSNSGGYVESARDYAQRLMQASPNDPFANYVYALSFGRDANDPRAVKAANIALNYYRDMRFAETNLNLIDILVRAGQTEGLKKRLYFSSIWARDASARSAAREMLKRLPE